MTTNKIYVTESPIYQAANEALIYAFEWSAIGTPAAAGTVTLTNLTSGASLGTANLTGDPTQDGTKINTPTVFGLAPNQEYLLESLAVIDGKTLALQCKIIGA